MLNLESIFYLESSIHHSSPLPPLEKMFYRSTLWIMNFLTVLCVGLSTCELWWPFDCGRTGGLVAGTSLLRSARRGTAQLAVEHWGWGAGVFLLPRSPKGRGKGMVERKMKRVSTTGPGCTLDFPTTSMERAPRKGLKKTSAVGLLTPCFAKLMSQNSNYKQ